MEDSGSRLVENELRFLGQVGAALWSESSRGASQVGDAIELAGMGARVPEGRVELAARTLIDRARAAGTLAFRDSVGDPFWRIPLELRFLLAAAHGPYRASYVRLQRMLSARAAAGAMEEDFDDFDEEAGPAGRTSGLAGSDTSAVQQLLWSARTQLAVSLGIPLPRGAGQRSTSCPEYRSREPWTQRFLDDEISVRERLYLQNHLMNCAGCRGALEECRRLLAALEAQLHRRGVLVDAASLDADARARREAEAAVQARPTQILWVLSFAGVAVLLTLLCWPRG